MPDISIPDDLFRRLSDQAKALNRSVDAYVLPTLQHLADYGQPLSEWKPPTEEEWRRVWEEWDREIMARASRYPPGFQVDDSREAMYFGRDEAEP
jgi:hypothetical protein